MKKFLAILMILVLSLAAFVACNGNDAETESETEAVAYDANAAVDYVFNLYKEKTTLTGDLDVTSKVMINNVLYAIEWSATEGATITKKDDNTYTVDVNETTAEEYTFTLTATAKAPDGTSASKTFTMTVPAYELLTFEQYMAAEADDIVTVQGIVVAINSKDAGNTRNHLFLADENVVGGYYSYQMDQDPVKDLGIEIGMVVSVTGPVAPYSGMQEIKGGTAQIISTEKKTVEAVDITEKFAAGESLANYVALPVIIKDVEITTQELGGTSEYLKFKLNGVVSYIRTYVTDFPTTLKVEDKATIDAAHAEHFGWKADVTGILVLYNSAPYLIPTSVDCFNYIEKIEKTPDQKVVEALEMLEINTFISEDTTLELPLVSTVHSDVTFAWTVDKEGYTIGEDGKIALTVSETPVELIFTVTATCGEAIKAQEIKVKVALPTVTIEEAMELPDGATVVLTGVVTGIKSDWSEKYGNMDVYLSDATGTILVFRVSTMLNVGDVIKLTGKMGTYNDERQIAQGATVETLTVSTVDEAVAMEDDAEVILKGTVSGIKSDWSETYGNMDVYLTDAAGKEILVFRTSTKVAEGDEIVLFGKVGSYKGDKQIAQGATAVITLAANTEDDGEGEGEGGGDVPAIGVDEIAVETDYYLAGVNAAGSLYAKNALANGRLDASATVGEAAVWQLEAGAAEGEYYIFTMLGDVKTYLGANSAATESKTSQFLMSSEKTDDCIWIVDVAAKSIVSKNFTGRCIGTQNTSTYNNFSTYATSNFSDADSIYRYVWFVAVEA